MNHNELYTSQIFFCCRRKRRRHLTESKDGGNGVTGTAFSPLTHPVTHRSHIIFITLCVVLYHTQKVETMVKKERCERKKKREKDT